MIARVYAEIVALVRAEAPDLTFRGVYEYTVQAVRGGVVDVAPASALPLPAIVGLVLVPSTLGEAVTGVVVGQRVLVRFVDANPTRPEIAGLSAPSVSSTIDATDELELGASSAEVELAAGTAPVARRGDEITISLPSSPVPVSGILTGTLNFSGLVTFTGSGTGIVTAGNPRVTS